MTDLLYHTDSYLRVFTATVIATHMDEGAVALDRTAFYPGGGGQPHDLGLFYVQDQAGENQQAHPHRPGGVNTGMDILRKIAEQRIHEAMEGGEFDLSAYHGKALKLDELAGVPEALRMGYKILKNAGVLPQEMQLKKEILALRDLLNACTNDAEQHRLQECMNEKMLRYSMLMERQHHKPAYGQYEAKLRKRLGLSI